MLRAYRGFGGYRDGTNPRSWLCKILYNTWISSYRARQCRPLEQLTGEFTDRQIAQGYQCSSSSSRSAEAEVLEACGDSETVSAFKSQPAELRHAVYFADVEGLRCHEIARIMARPIGTVNHGSTEVGIVYGRCWQPSRIGTPSLTVLTSTNMTTMAPAPRPAKLMLTKQTMNSSGWASSHGLEKRERAADRDRVSRKSSTAAREQPM